MLELLRSSFPPRNKHRQIVSFYSKSQLKYPFHVFQQQEDALAQQAFEEARRRTREFEDRDRSHREEMEVRVSQLLAVTG